MFLEHGARVPGGDETAANQHAVTISHAQLVVGVHQVDGLLDGVGKVRLLDDAITPEHAYGDVFKPIGRHHALSPRVLGHHHLAQYRLKHAQIFLDLLVFHHGHHTDELLEMVVFLQRGAQRFGGAHVVPAIDDDGGRSANLLDAPGNFHA